MTNGIIALVTTVIVFLAGRYVVKSKAKSSGCIGCPSCGSCTKHCNEEKKTEISLY